MPVPLRVMPTLIIALSFATLAGCAWLPQSDAGASLRISGLMQLTADSARLESCAGPVHTLHADEPLRALFSQVAQPGQTGIFVDLRGEQLADGSIRPETVMRMGSSTGGCADPVALASSWVALGEQPPWQIQIGSAGMQVRRDTPADGWLSVITEQLPEGIRSFRALDGEPVELWLYPQPCFARRSGDYYQYTARLVQAGDSVAGCAYQGQGVSDQPPR